MSIAKTVVTWAEIRFDRTMCSAVFLRIGLMGTTSTRDDAEGAEVCGAGPAEGAETGGAVGGLCGVGATGAGVGIGLAAAAGASAGFASMWVRMSCLVTRPAMPVPGMSRMSRLCSAAIFRTTGEERVCRSSSTVMSPRPADEPAEDAEPGEDGPAEGAEGGGDAGAEGGGGAGDQVGRGGAGGIAGGGAAAGAGRGRCRGTEGAGGNCRRRGGGT